MDILLKKAFLREIIFNWSSCALKFHGGASVLWEIVFLGWKFFRIAKLENINFYF